MYTGKYFKVWFYSYSDQNNIQLKKKKELNLENMPHLPKVSASKIPPAQIWIECSQ